MKRITKYFITLTCFFCLMAFLGFSPSITKAAEPAKKGKEVKEVKKEGMETWSKPNARFDASKMGDMSGWDPAK